MSSSNFTKRKNVITLAPAGKIKKGPKWRTALVLVSVPVERVVTDRSIARWVRDAVQFYESNNDYCRLEHWCRPHKVGKPVVTEYHRHVRGKKAAARHKKSANAVMAEAQTSDELNQ